MATSIQFSSNEGGAAVAWAVASSLSVEMRLQNSSEVASVSSTSWDSRREAVAAASDNTARPLQLTLEGPSWMGMALGPVGPNSSSELSEGLEVPAVAAATEGTEDEGVVACDMALSILRIPRAMVSFDLMSRVVAIQ